MITSSLRTVLAELAVGAFAATLLAAPEQSRQDALKLNQLQKVFAAKPQFGEQFWAESKRVADRTGPGIVHAIMERSKQWRNEEGLVFVPLVALLPRKPTLELLQYYEGSSQKSHRVWAHEFLIELDSPDVKASVRKLNGT